MSNHSRNTLESAIVSLMEAEDKPAYHYDLDKLSLAIDRLKSYLPKKSSLFYSMKANPHPALVTHIYNQCCSLEVSSIGEIDIAISQGIDPLKISVTGPVKSPFFLEYCLAKGIRLFSIESIQQWQHLSEAASNIRQVATVILRINPALQYSGANMNMMGEASPFGIDYQWVKDNPDHFDDHPYLHITGLHFYTCSGVFDDNILLNNYRQGTEIAVELSHLLKFPLKHLNLGGGFGHAFAKHQTLPDFSNLAQGITQLLDQNVANWKNDDFTLAFESGRAIVADCGQYYCKIVEVKSSQSKQFAIANGGIHHLGGMAGLRKIPRTRPCIDCLVTHAQTTSEDSNPVEYNIVGPLCTPLDKLIENFNARNLWPGDYIAIPNVGAYGLTASLLGFLSHPCPLEVITSNNKIREVSFLTMSRQQLSIEQEQKTPKSHHTTTSNCHV